MLSMVTEMDVDIADNVSFVSSSDSRTSLVPCDHCHADFINVVALQNHAARCSVKAKKAINARSVYLSGFKRTCGMQPSELRLDLCKYGVVEKIIPDHAWHRYAIIQMKTIEEAKKLIEMEWIDIDGQRIHVKPAQLKPILGEFEPQEFTTPQIIAQLGKQSDLPVIQQLEAVKSSFGIDAESLEWRTATCAYLNKLFSKFFTFQVKPQLFGSSVTGFGTKFADVDISLSIVPSKDEPTEPAVERNLMKCALFVFLEEKVTYSEFMKLSKNLQFELLARVMHERYLRGKCILSHMFDIHRAKHPLVKFVTHSKLLCELSYENEFGIAKADFLMNFTKDKNGVLHNILFVLRLWAQTQDIYGPLRKYRQTYFTSYAFSLLFVAFLQHKGILGPVVTVGENIVNGWAVDYDVPEVVVNADDATIIEIIRGFFIFVSQNIHEHSTLSIRDGTIQTYDDFLKEFADDERIAKDFTKAVINIQDPLELSHNVSAGVNADCMSLLRKKAMRSLAKLKKATQNHQIAAIFDLDDAASPSRLNPRVDDPEFTFVIDLPKDTPGTMIQTAIDIIMEDVLKFDRNEPDEGIPKRRRLNTGHGSTVYTTTTPVWLGRRKLKREFGRQFPDERNWKIEKLVTAELLANEEKPKDYIVKNTPLVQFGLVTRFDEKVPSLTVVFTPKFGERATYNDVFRFLKQFLTNDNGKFVADVLRDAVGDMFQNLTLA